MSIEKGKIIFRKERSRLALADLDGLATDKFNEGERLENISDRYIGPALCFNTSGDIVRGVVEMQLGYIDNPDDKQVRFVVERPGEKTDAEFILPNARAFRVISPEYKK